MKNIAIIPARSGSKGLKDKNIKKLNGKPLLAFSVEAALDSNLFDEIMVSTDSELYADVARSFGASVPFLRSSECSTDNAGSWDVVEEVLREYKEMGRFFDTVCLLQPTSPLRTACDIKQGYDLLIKKECDAITSVCEVDHSPLWAMVLPADNSLSDFKKTLQSSPRQHLPQYHRINGALYIRRIMYIKNQIVLLDDDEYALIMKRDKSVDIDTIEDFAFAEYLLSQKEEKEK